MITSLSNKKIKNVSALLSKSKERKKQGVFVVEGIKMFVEAPSKWIVEAYIDEKLYQEVQAQEADKAFIDKIQSLPSGGLEIVQSDVFRKMSDTQTPQGILCVLKKPGYSLKDILKSNANGLYLMLEDIQDPGNLGTMIRAGEGAGITGVIMSAGTVDAFNPKTVRATMGSIYRVPFCYVSDFRESIAELKKHNITVYAAHLQGEKSYDQFDYEQSVAFMIGNEGNGLQDETADMADSYLKIPMLGEVESLNAAIAATLLAYEAARQRRN